MPPPGAGGPPAVPADPFAAPAQAAGRRRLAVGAIRQVSAPGRCRPASAQLPAEWTAVLDDGREISVDGLVLLGRNPQPQPGEEDAQLIKIADETRTVSKSHLAIGLDAGGIFVVDRGSTNGSTVTTPEGVSTRCRTGEVIYVERRLHRLDRRSLAGDPPS